jgi:hypothetical protein
VDSHGSGHTLHPELTEVVEGEVALDEGRRRRRQVTGVRLGQALHALREPNGVPLRRVVHAQVVADRADHHLARVDAHARREADAVLALHLGRVAGDLVTQRERRVAGALGVVLVRDRRPEQRHDAVARVLVDRALEAVHALAQDLEEAVEDAVPLLGVELLGQLYRALHVGEQDGDLLPLTFEGASRSQNLRGEVFRGVGARVRRRCSFRGLSDGLPALTAELDP